MANKEKDKKYMRYSKDMTPDKVEDYLNEKFNEGWNIIYYNERIMSTDNVWITVVFQRKTKMFL